MFVKTWDEFRNRVIHPEAPEIQVKEMRLAFYAGASVMMETFQSIAGMELPDELACMIMDNMKRELLDYFATVIEKESQ